MGQNCSTSCKQVEVENPELSRHESPDPVMYDLMRKSIQATTPPPPTTNSGKANKRRPHGQHHLLFKHSPKSSVDSLQYLHPHHSSIDSGVGSGLTGMVSSTTSPITSNWTPTEFPTMGCPTRLLIRRRSLRVIEEGGGTHIYAIRYPEDTKDAIVAEQSALPVPASRQEQCPPKRSHSSSVQTNPNNKESLPLPVLEGGDIFTTAAMASIPRQSGKCRDQCRDQQIKNCYIGMREGIFGLFPWSFHFSSLQNVYCIALLFLLNSFILFSFMKNKKITCICNE